MKILKFLRTNRNATESSEPEEPLSVTILSPYSRQVKLLRSMLANDSTLSKNTEVHTIDGFQGREAEVIIFTTVRSNNNNDIGFLQDERRLNVALTRAQLARIIVGNENTLREPDSPWRKERGGEDGESGPGEGADQALSEARKLWGRAIKDCTKVELPQEAP